MWNQVFFFFILTNSAKYVKNSSAMCYFVKPSSITPHRKICYSVESQKKVKNSWFFIQEVHVCQYLEYLNH